MNISAMSNSELRQFYGDVMAEFARRGVLVNGSLTGGYAESLVCHGLNLKPLEANTPKADAFDPSNCDRYQIKGSRSSGSRVQVSPLRDLESPGFDFLVVVVFNGDFSVRRAAKIPHKVVLEFAKYNKANNAHIFSLTDRIMKQPGVKDIRCLLNPDEPGDAHS